MSSAATRTSVDTGQALRPRRRRLLWLIPLLLLPVPLLLNQYQQYVVNLMLVYVPVGVGFNVVVGNLGLLAFSNVAFFGIGAYTTGILMLKLGLPWWLTVLPAPFGPMSAQTSPASTRKETRSTAVSPPKRTVTSDSSSSGDISLPVIAVAEDRVRTREQAG